MFRAFIVLALAAGAWAQTAAPAENSAAPGKAPSFTPENSSQDKSDFRTSKPTPKPLPAAEPSSTTPSPKEDYAAESALLALANQSRLQASVPPLHIDENLTEAARAHAKLMVKWQQLSHQFDGEHPLMIRLTEVGLQIDRAGENVAYNASVEKAFAALMQSTPHRRNLLDPNFNAAGFAVVWSGGHLYVVQDFAHTPAHVVSTSAK